MENIQEDKKLKIGIIGGGISGCASAYFLRETFGDKIEIVLFEKSDHLGGRLSTYEFQDREYEIGGSILHPSNLYMKQFLEVCGLKKREKEKSSQTYLGLYDSAEIVFSMTGEYFGILDKIKFLKHFGLVQVFRFNKWIKKFIKDFSKIYKLQDHGFTFLNLEQFLNKLNPSLYKASQQSLRQVLESQKFGDRIINQLASIACLSNYGQTVDIDGLVGLVSLAGTADKLWSIKGGNKQVPIKLLEISGANVMLNTRVKLIAKDFSQPETKNLITYQNQMGEEILDNSFDYVLISFPIYKNVIGENFQLKFDNLYDFSGLEMQLTNTYVVYGEQKLYDELPLDKRIDLHSVDPDVPYRCLSFQLPVDYSKKNDKNMYIGKGAKLYKLFAEQELEPDVLDFLFEENYQLVKKVPWLAYPKYNLNPSSKSIPDVILDSHERSRVFYLNSLEWSSSCMEICVISARNVVNLIAHKEKQRIKKFFTPKAQKNETFQETLHRWAKVTSAILIGAFVISSYYKI